MAVSLELKMLALVGAELWVSHLIGGAPPSHTKRWNRMREPKRGDVVIEMSTSGWWRNGLTHPKLKFEDVIGFLDRVTDEPYPHQEGDDPWDVVAEGRPEPLEKVFYLNRLHDGSECRWTNANFVTILPV